MRKITILYGLGIGAVQGLLLLVPFALLDPSSIDRNYAFMEKFGYTIMIISMGGLFLGVRHYRNKVLGGLMGFWRALAAGLNISVTAAAVFGLGTWVLYRFVKPGFPQEFLKYQARKIRESGEPPEVIVAKLEALAAQKDFFLDPGMQGAVMFVTVSLIGIPIALLSAAILKKKM